jgi:hypothetical protein
LDNAEKGVTTLEWIQWAFEYLGGERDDPPAGLSISLGNWVFWAIWWGALALLIFVFSGQSSKFIYIDF